MAVMFPVKLPSNASAGERRVFSILQNLPDEVEVYYEPVVGRRYPDFVVILPNAGLMIIEVKGWYPRHIVGFDNHEMRIRNAQSEAIEKHPLRQARDYMFGLMDRCRKHAHAKHLIHRSGVREGKFLFPFGHFVVMNNMTREQIESFADSGNDSFVTRQNSLARDELLALEEADTQSIENTLQKFFDPVWPIETLNHQQLDTLRGVLSPSRVHPGPRDTVTGEPTIILLDRAQYSKALEIGDGHRIVRGVAGSGKTLLLVSRAKIIAEDGSKRVLVLCFNKALAVHLRNCFEEFPNIDAVHFHKWGASQGADFTENATQYGEQLLQLLYGGSADAGRYDAVCIDEGQDFDRTWFLCAKEALKEPDDGDLLIVMDGNQNLYRRRSFTWSSAGINARGRVLPQGRFDLNKNYRNTFEILHLAREFAQSSIEDDDDVALQAALVEPSAAVRRGSKPVYYQASTRAQENTQIINVVKQILAEPSKCGNNIRPSDVAILYPRLFEELRADRNALLDDLAKLAPVSVMGKPYPWDGGKNTTPVSETIRVNTIHSSKGLQYKAVIVCWVDTLPFKSNDEIAKSDSALLYVAMTRAEDKLVMTSTGRSAFTEILELKCV